MPNRKSKSGISSKKSQHQSHFLLETPPQPFVGPPESRSRLHQPRPFEVLTEHMAPTLDRHETIVGFPVGREDWGRVSGIVVIELVNGRCTCGRVLAVTADGIALCFDNPAYPPGAYRTEHIATLYEAYRLTRMAA
ncbi:S24/S26 family peptidase [Larkinella soli]|uniref:S24/S26 family peptidase n=1 Tax=Larkinella soli TaxID=1770527 RepID=UPI000FFB92D9|nr:S24/S26 family peptidase [Larkinella soli]